MKNQNSALVKVFLALFVSFLFPSTVQRAAAQTATSGTVVGAVTDPSGAAVPKAEVRLENLGTGAPTIQTANAAGEFTFANVTPGTYKITVTAAGFRTSQIPNLVVDVNKSTNVPVHLEVGGQNQIVEVTAAATAQLQTTDAQVGSVIETESIQRLPTLQRNVTELMNLQAGVTAVNSGVGAPLEMRTTGAIEDQNTVTLDGVDITQSVISASTVVPTPADSVEEFRVTTSDPTANLAKASGGQVTLIGRHGTNTFHGALYEYLQNSDLNANTWDNNFAHIPKAPIKDNRFGARLGGPIFRNKTFFFVNYEGRRYNAVSEVTRTVPTPTLKAGILQFRDAAGNVDSYNLATSTLCGASGTSACDPRGLGISPSVKALWSLMPNPNIPGGDGLNTGGYLANIAAPITDDYYVARLDHTFSDKLVFNGSYTYFRDIATPTNPAQISIENGQPRSVKISPQRGDVITGALTWTARPNLINVIRFGWTRNRDAGEATTPTQAASILNIPGTQTADGPIALLPGSGVSGGIDAPIDMDTQRGRFQSDNNKDIQYMDDVTWIKGKHTFQFGFQANDLPYTHVRADKVLGSITSLVAVSDVTGAGGSSASFLSIPGTDTPPSCSGTITANCLKSSDVTNWGRYYASVLGLVDNVNVLAVRNSNLQPLPLGTNLTNITDQQAYYFYGQDTWRLTRNLTVSLGLSYGWQTAPTEAQGRQTIMINADTGQPITAEAFLQAKLQAALAGQIYNPTVGFEPVKDAHRSVYNVDWGDISPRAAFAWNPSYHAPVLGWLFGDKKAVIRGGFAKIFDRSNTVQSVEIPMLGVGFDQTINVALPSCGISGTPGAGCNAAAGSANPGLSSFRVGVDGTLPLPTPSAVTSPVIPASPFGEILSFQVDPNTKIGRSYNVDFSYQREIPGGFLLDMAYVGRFARDLPQAVNLTQSPYMFVDSASKESFAQAFDSVATALRAGQAAPTQAWFENQLPGLAAQKGTATATAYVAKQLSSSFVNGNVASIFQSLGTYRRGLGLQPYNNDQAQMEFMRTYIGYSNYNGLLVSLNKRLSHGLSFTANYTYSKSLDDDVIWQNNAGFYQNSFYPGVEYGPSPYDRTNTFNGYYVYDLPAGKGHAFSTGNWIDKVIGGWYTSGIFTAWTGLPLIAVESSQVWGDGTILGTNSGLIPTGPLPATGLNGNVNGTSGIATSGNGANGTGLNLFANPAAAYADFRPVLISADGRSGRANPFRGLPFWNFDLSVGKSTNITERLRVRFSADFFNIFNHPNFNNPSLNYQSPSTFGVITTEAIPPNRINGARAMELGLRVEF